MSSIAVTNTCASSRRCLVCNTEEPVITGRPPKKGKRATWGGIKVRAVRLQISERRGFVSSSRVLICEKCLEAITSQDGDRRIVRSAVGKRLLKALSMVYRANLAQGRVA